MLKIVFSYLLYFSFHGSPLNLWSSYGWSWGWAEQTHGSRTWGGSRNWKQFSHPILLLLVTSHCRLTLRGPEILKKNSCTYCNFPFTNPSWIYDLVTGGPGKGAKQTHGRRTWGGSRKGKQFSWIHTHAHTKIKHSGTTNHQTHYLHMYLGCTRYLLYMYCKPHIGIPMQFRSIIILEILKIIVCFFILVWR